MKALLPFLLVTAATIGVLWQSRAPATPTATAEPLPWTPSLHRTQESGRRIYLRSCVWCHGQERDGLGPNATRLVIPPPDLTTHAEGAVVDWLEGRRSRRAPLCPDWAGALTPAERRAVAQYLAARRLTAPGT
jgi:mono/diheme cytochrome c family protein